MKNDFTRYHSLIFDCDGVILNSNQIKSDAFYNVAKQFGDIAAKKLLKFHLENGGISRYKKFEYLMSNLIKNDESKKTIDDLCNEFSVMVVKNLIKAEINENLLNFIESNKEKNLLVVSGGDQNELRSVFKKRNLLNLFKGGIYGSPENKINIFTKLKKNKIIMDPAIYFGDSKYDYFSSKECNLNFCFVSHWTEVNDWRDFCKSESINFINNFPSTKN